MGPMNTADAERRPRLLASNVNSLRENGLEAPLLDRAVGALLKHDADRHSSGKSGGKSTLLEDDRDVHVQFALARVPQRPSPKPIRVDIPHPLVRVPRLEGTKGRSDSDGDGDDADYLEDADICLLVSTDTTKTWVKDLIDKFPSHLGRIKKVLTLSSLRTKQKRFNQRRELLATYDIFLADDRILPMLGKALGKSFFEKKNLPIPIKITRKEAFPFAVQRCLRATFIYLSAGTCVTVKVGTTAMPPRHLAENVQSAVKNAVEKLPRKWANVSGVFVKTAKSVALPVYSRTPEELAEIASLAGIAEADDSERSDEKAPEEKKRKGITKEDEVGKKRRKRGLASKSPLLQALRKQKEGEGVDAQKYNKNSPTKMGEKKVENTDTTSAKMDTGVEEAKDSEGLPKNVKKKKKQRKSSEIDKEESSGVAKEKSEEKARKSAKKKRKAAESGGGDVDFVAAKKFRGSKKGYHFRRGREGLGYYRDVVPTPDRATLEAMVRAFSTPSRGRGGGSGSVRRSKSRGSGRRGGGRRR